MSRSRGERGQSTVELAVVLPAVIVVAAVVLQVGVLARDRIALVHTTRVVARAVIVDPSPAAARSALRRHDPGAGDTTVALSGPLRPGSIVTVELSRSPTRVPLVGRLVGGVQLRERLAVLVEGER